jgi:hypothetical protein
LITAKQGNEENIVVLSLVATDDNVCVPDPNFGQNWMIGERLMAFTELFTYGFVGDLCAPSYDEYFAEALSVIDTACEGFVPPG